MHALSRAGEGTRPYASRSAGQRVPLLGHLTSPQRLKPHSLGLLFGTTGSRALPVCALPIRALPQI